MTSVHISPTVQTSAVGGISRVVEAQVKYLPEYGIEVTTDSANCNVLAMHAAMWIPPKPNQRTVSHCHGLYWAGYEWNSRWYSATNAQVIENMRQADIVTVPSEWVANSVRHGTWLDNVRVIGHGVDISEWEPAPHNGYILWDKSRVDPICDPRPVNVLAAAMQDVKFRTTFGDMANNVQVIGETSYKDHHANIQHAMLYLATARETFGISVLEALACGVPVVGWDWAGQADIVTKDVGYLAKLGDYDDLVRGIRYCIANREALSEQARELIRRKYQWKQVIRQYAYIYEELESFKYRPPFKVSVVIPSYNLGKYLPACIASVIGQDYDNYEIIIVDDCSTDNSLAIAKQYENGASRVKVLRTPHNLYLAGALNYGIERATGEYILPLDADNYLAPGTLRTLADSLGRDRSLDIVYGKVKFVTEDGQPDRSVSGDGISGWPPAEFNYDAQMAHRNQIPSTSMYRRRVWSRIGGYRQRCKTAEDADFWCRATSFGAKPKHVTDAVTLVYRNRTDSMSHVQADWSWEAWYSWADKHELTPYIAPRDKIPVYTYEPLVVSFIIPVGPGHETQGLQDALDSIYSQTVQNWEVLVINDTGQAIPWLPSWAKTYNTKGLQGVSVARNIGLSKMSRLSEFFVFLDADDYLDAEFLAKTIKAYRKHGGYVYTDWFKDNETVVNIDRFKCADQLHNLHHPITCLYPAAIKRNKFDETLRVGEDWDYILSVQAAGYCGTHVQAPLVYYRQSSGNNRKELLRDIDNVRDNLNRKWGDKMGCGCGSGGGGIVIDNTMPLQEAAMQGDLVLLEFVKPDAPVLSWTGKSTGYSYRFGSEDNHRIGYVHRSDALEFLKRDEFELVSP